MIDLERADRALTKPTTTLSGPLNTAARYCWAQLKVRLEEVLKTIASQSGFVLLAARVHRGDHVHVFVSAPPKACIPVMVRVLKCNSAKLLFEEFPLMVAKSFGVDICGQRDTP